MRKFDAMFNAAYVAVNVCDKTHGCSDSNHTPCLQRKILDYFAGDDNNHFSKKMDQSRFYSFLLLQVFSTKTYVHVLSTMR